MKYVFVFALILFSAFPLENHAAIAQQNPEYAAETGVSVYFNHLVLSKTNSPSLQEEASLVGEMKFLPLTHVEENLARNLNSHWVWPEYSLDMIDSYSEFLFRTKKSQALQEVKVLLNVNSKGRVSGFEVLSEVDKATKERLDYVIRKLPDCKPVPGFATYSAASFELTIKK